MKKIKDWKQIYVLPIEHDGYSYAWAENGTMALMFSGLTKDEQKRCVKTINGDDDFRIENLVVDGCDFFKDKEHIFCVRGWGNLTGFLNLTPKKAIEIQDGFINHVFKALTN